MIRFYAKKLWFQSFLGLVSCLFFIDIQGIYDFIIYKKSLSIILQHHADMKKMHQWENWVKSYPMVYYASLDRGLQDCQNKEFLDDCLKNIRNNFDLLSDEKEKIIAFSLIDKWKTFDQDFEPWLIEKGQLLFPEEVSFKARAYIFQWPEEFSEDLSHEKKRKVLDFIEGMLRF